MLKVRDIMTAGPITVSPETSLRNAIELFTREHISGAPVVSGGKLVGVISSSDLLAFAAAPPDRADLPDPGEAFDSLSEIEPDAGVDMADDTVSDSAFFTDMLSDADTEVDVRMAGMLDPGVDVLDEYTVADAMTTGMKTIRPEMDATAAARLMAKARVHRLIVVERNRPIGIISTTDLTRAVAERLLPEQAIIAAATSTDFDPGWSHEPIVPYPDVDEP
jgi:CBS domain-containing protein